MKELYIDELIKSGKPYYHEIINKTLVSPAKQKQFEKSGFYKLTQFYSYKDYVDSNYYTWVVKSFKYSTSSTFSGKILDSVLCLTKDFEDVVKKYNSTFEFPVYSSRDMLIMFVEIQDHLEKATRAGVITDYYRRMAYLDMSYRLRCQIGEEGAGSCENKVNLDTLYDVYDNKEEK